MGKNDIDRRTFLKMGGLLATGAVVAPGSQLLIARAAGSSGSKDEKQYAMVIDLDKCDGSCDDECATACREENNVPIYGKGKEYERYNAWWLRMASAKQHQPGAPEREIPLLCMHCEDPPCVHVCVTKASFVREDGIVLIDEHLCIGCRYCVIACPYRARSMIFRKWDDAKNEQLGYEVNPNRPELMIGVASKCSFCVHLVDKGEDPACVQKCPNDAFVFGDAADPDSEVAKMIATGNTEVLRPVLEVEPHVHYKGL
ncbi:MAG: sulfate reduction electron transfer complex DsrMKJOP subunit DsrO [Thermoleophilia bacterium]